jgi:hypothetical protein
MWEDGSALDYTNWNQNQTIVNKQQPENEGIDVICVFTQPSDLKCKQCQCTGYTQRNHYICHTKKLLNTSHTPVSMPFVSNVSFKSSFREH